MKLHGCVLQGVFAAAFVANVINNIYIYVYTNIHIYIYIYMCICVCVCVYISSLYLYWYRHLLTLPTASGSQTHVASDAVWWPGSCLNLLTHSCLVTVDSGHTRHVLFQYIYLPLYDETYQLITYMAFALALPCLDFAGWWSYVQISSNSSKVETTKEEIQTGCLVTEWAATGLILYCLWQLTTFRSLFTIDKCTSYLLLYISYWYHIIIFFKCVVLLFVPQRKKEVMRWIHQQKHTIYTHIYGDNMP